MILTTFTQDKKKERDPEIRREEKRNWQRLLRRTVSSLFIPLAISALVSIFATFVFRMNGGTNYFRNVLEIFCKILFPSLPLMMMWITK